MEYTQRQAYVLYGDKFKHAAMQIVWQIRVFSYLLKYWRLDWSEYGLVVTLAHW